ncbi:MAG: DNA polymerase III subunit gamma/tau [Endomicrobiales bacterium]|nr:DNA polymerase III subunit gamma/tau [Endomicrobiales bacterium]
MSYIVFARRYRPQNFDQIIGQDHISQTLKNAISENRVAHAYLFSGPRGVGKTTTARIMAKALNCKKGPTQDPCGECPNCLDITAGSSVDVQEIDGASNRGIDEIRALRENVKFAPASSKYKIYIIDEAHQITDAAFNALLKTLEEPPDHVVFILATTEPQKVPLTILSRCQRYRFKPLSSKEIVTVIEKIMGTESIKIDKTALQMITASCGGSMRDALSLLDQVVSFASNEITAEHMQDLLGFLPKEIVTSAAKALSARDSAGLLGLIKKTNDEGYSLTQFAKDLREHLRKLLLFKINPEALEIIPEEEKTLSEQKELFGVPWLLRAGKMISKAMDDMKYSDEPRLVLELHMLKLAQPYVPASELMEKLEKMESGIPPEDGPAQPPSVRYAEKNAEDGSDKLEFGVKEQAAPRQQAGPGGEQNTVVKETDGAASVWDAVVSDIRKNRPLVGSILQGAGARNGSGNVFNVIVQNQFQADSVARNQGLIEECIQKKTGQRYAVRPVIEEKPQASKQEAPEVVAEEIVAENGGGNPGAVEVFEVEEEVSAKKSVPSGLEKIASKFPGKITKKK